MGCIHSELDRIDSLDNYVRSCRENKIKHKVNMSVFQVPCYSMVYCLELENGKYYVGTSTQLNQRIANHFEGQGARWTKMHKPVRIYSVCIGNRDTEKSVTLKIMAQFGWKNVRGGPWCKPKMFNPPSDLRSFMESRETEVQLTIVDGATTLTDSRTEAVAEIAQPQYTV